MQIWVKCIMYSMTSLFLGQILFNAFDISVITGNIIYKWQQAVLTRFVLLVGRVTVTKEMFKKSA